ncbi:MAG: hypothetical protein HY784_02545, partial [Chloroflexi bacterium]|nr:hypothetical protein [Chloroflexota bacterium]
ERAADELERQLRGASARQAELDRWRHSKQLADMRVGAARQQLATLANFEKQRERRRAELAHLANQKGLFEDLREAFGKRGVRAMIIETAVPEIDAAANELLGRMTAGRMHVRIETQKEIKTGEVREALDIQIADELGTRAYENYSIDGAEPVCVRRNDQIVCANVEELWQSSAPTAQMGNGYETQAANFESLCYHNGQAVWMPTESMLRHSSPAEMLKIAVKPGNYSVTITPGHSIFVMTPEGLVVKRGDQVLPGDWLLTPRRIPEIQTQAQVDLLEWVSPEFMARRRNLKKPLQWDEQTIWSRRDQPLSRYVLNNTELAEFLGLAVAEASGRNTLSVAVGSNRQMAERVVALANSLFGVSRDSLAEVSAQQMVRYVANAPGISSLTPREQFRPVVGGRLLAHVIGNMIGHGAHNQRIPPNIFSASDDAKLAFLKALIAGNGNFRVRPAKSQVEIGITTVSPRLAAGTILL